MPPKKSLGLGRKSREQKKILKSRGEETSQQTQERLQKSREYKSQQRENEDEDEREERLSREKSSKALRLKSLKKSDIKWENKMLRKAQV